MRRFLNWMAATSCVGLLAATLWAQQDDPAAVAPKATSPGSLPKKPPVSPLDAQSANRQLGAATQPSYGQPYDPAPYSNYPFGMPNSISPPSSYTQPPNGVRYVPQIVNGATVYRPESASPVSSEFQNAVAQLRSAKTDDERSEARKKLSEIIAVQMEKDLADREQRIAEIEKRAKELREQLQQRRDSKAELQKMLVMLVENQQSGLGLPASWLNAINTPFPAEATWSGPSPYVQPQTGSSYQPQGVYQAYPNYNPNLLSPNFNPSLK